MHSFPTTLMFVAAMAFGGQAVAQTPKPTPPPGGFPLIENGKINGAVGCSGGTGDQDAAVCGAGAATVK